MQRVSAPAKPLEIGCIHCWRHFFGSDTTADGILATRLFKPDDSVGQHRPVHKIVAEYCAAEYLTKRIADPADPLTLPKCLPIIAPNSTVRDELRGLLGWMAALGNRPYRRICN